MLLHCGHLRIPSLGVLVYGWDDNKAHFDFDLGTHFILVEVAVDSESIPGILSVSWEYGGKQKQLETSSNLERKWRTPDRQYIRINPWTSLYH